MSLDDPIHSTYVSDRSPHTPGILGIVTATHTYEWQIVDLLAIAATRTPATVEIDQLDVVDEDVWFAGTGRTPTLRALAADFRQTMDADLTRPLLAIEKIGLIDGTHRIVKALVEGRTHIEVVTLNLADLEAVPHTTA